MRSDHWKLAFVFKGKAGQVFSRKQIISMTIKAFPGTNPDSILPNDHATKHIGCCGCVQDEKTKLFDKEVGWGLYRVRDFSQAGSPCKPQPTSRRVCLPQPNKPKLDIAALWNCKDEVQWKAALSKYWACVKPQNMELEKELNKLHQKVKSPSDISDWYSFLLNKYFPWKYTDPRRNPKRYFKEEYGGASGKAKLDSIIKQLFTFNRCSISQGLKIKIKGLRVPGISGLLSLLFPECFGTVDKYVVKALRRIKNLPQINEVCKMDPTNLAVEDGGVLIEIMRDKAKQLNQLFNSDFWTPRKIDMVLWAARDP